MATSKENIEQLANYLMKHWSHEIGAGDPVRGESAVEVAIRLLERLRLGHTTSPEVEPLTESAISASDYLKDEHTIRP